MCIKIYEKTYLHRYHIQTFENKSKHKQYDDFKFKKEKEN